MWPEVLGASYRVVLQQTEQRKQETPPPPPPPPELFRWSELIWGRREDRPCDDRFGQVSRLTFWIWVIFLWVTERHAASALPGLDVHSPGGAVGRFPDTAGHSRYNHQPRTPEEPGEGRTTLRKTFLTNTHYLNGCFLSGSWCKSGGFLFFVFRVCKLSKLFLLPFLL